ncbi:unnamed protein product, partial [Prorocentrum cordatum]
MKLPAGANISVSAALASWAAFWSEPVARRAASACEVVVAGDFRPGCSRAEHWTVGGNFRGQLGDTSFVYRDTFDRVLAGVQAIDTGGQHAAVLMAGGAAQTARCISNGQLGVEDVADGQDFTDAALAGAQAVAASEVHSAALKSDGTRVAGLHTSGQLGLDDSTDGPSCPSAFDPAVHNAPPLRSAADCWLHTTTGWPPSATACTLARGTRVHADLSAVSTGARDAEPDSGFSTSPAPLTRPLPTPSPSSHL